MENINKSEKGPESEFPKYENLSEAQKEALAGQFGIEDAKTYDIVINGEITEGEYPFTNEEIREYLKQLLENEE